jgi:hypothetical protein
MSEYADLVLAVLSFIVVVVSLWIVHRVRPRLPR